MTTMTVTIRDRRGEDNYHYGPYFTTVTMPSTCPACGDDRGEPYQYQFCEDGAWYTVDRWDNPCGHIDRYEDVLKEAGV